MQGVTQRIPRTRGLSRIMIETGSPPCQLAFLNSEKAAEMYVDEALDGSGRLLYIDRSGSVSASVEVEVDAEYVREHNQLFLQEDPHGR